MDDKTDLKKAEMIMCGDHPSFTKTELNAKISADGRVLEKIQKEKQGYATLTPKASRTATFRVSSEQALRALDAKRRARSLEAVQRPDIEIAIPGNKALLQAALGSFRWPPYLLAVWVLVLIVTHVLHCLVTVLERVLPKIRVVCEYSRSWCEGVWREERSRRLYPGVVAAATALLYLTYYTLYLLYSTALWAIEPLSTEVDEKQIAFEEINDKIPNTVEELTTKSNSAIKS